MKQTGLVYIARDNENISYVGSTIKGLEVRRKQHEKSKLNDKFHNALREKGLDAFTWEVLEDNIPESKLLERERYWAKVYDACKNGYNGKSIQCFPRDINKERHHSEESRKKQSELMQGENNPMYGKNWTRSEETCKKISKATSGENNPMYGKFHSEESRKKQREAKLGKYNGDKNPMYGKPSPVKGKHWKLVDGKRVYS